MRGHLSLVQENVRIAFEFLLQILSNLGYLHFEKDLLKNKNSIFISKLLKNIEMNF